jgi:hypothetical protein
MLGRMQVVILLFGPIGQNRLSAAKSAHPQPFRISSSLDLVSLCLILVVYDPSLQGADPGLSPIVQTGYSRPKADALFVILNWCRLAVRAT